MDRRTLLAAATALIPAGLAGRASAFPKLPAMPKLSNPFASDLFAGLEARSGGRLGVAALDLKTGKRLEHRADERFPLCSTFKFLAVAAVLRRVDLGQAHLSDTIAYGQKDLVAYSPATTAHVADGYMALSDLCEAAMTLSDNTAGNLILSTLGGPAGVTGFARTLGDKLTRLDRTETSLNEAAEGDPRDTTTPAAMLANMHTLLLGPTLSKPERMRLTAWMVANTTGANRLRAGLPEKWKVGDKTGSGEHGTTNDIAILWPDANHPPILVAVYLTGSNRDDLGRGQILAETGRVVSKALRGVARNG